VEVAAKYRVQGTPMGYRIDCAGRIASELAVGADPLLRLANTLAPEQFDLSAAANGSTSHGANDDLSLARSRLNRSGLMAGTPAPDFRLPRMDGGELSLADFRGGRVLLVFSDPDCGPCDELAPGLQEIHLQRSELQVLVVSRRDVDSNRAKAASLGLSFPIVLQKQWEVSLQYAMFATPVGYLIDEQGILASDVAIGVGPILALAGEGVHESYAGESWPLAAEHSLANSTA
jgi:peroxiredoxin